MRRWLSALAMAAILAQIGTADGGGGRTSIEIQGDYQFPNHEATDASGLVPIVYGVAEDPSSSGTRTVGSSWGGGQLKAIIDQNFSFPFLAGSGALTSGNNLALDLSGELSPVSVNANFKATITPIAFLKLDAGAGLGTGWDIGFVGMGLNDHGTIVPQNFGGLIYRAWLEGVFQFDLAAILPGDWNHIVALASDKFQYEAYTGATDDQAWIWEADDGMDFNGWKLYGSYFLGYQMPIVLDTVGILAQTEGWLGAVRALAPSDGSAAQKWGSDFTYVTLSALFDFKLDSKSSLAVLPQFKTGIQWDSATQWNSDFQQRVYKDGFLYFYQLAFDYNLKL